MLSCLVLSCLVLSCLILPYLILSFLTLSYLILSYLISFYFILSHLILPCLVLSCVILSCLVLSCVLCCVVLSCAVLSCLVCPLFSCFVLSDLISDLIWLYRIVSYLVLFCLVLCNVCLTPPPPPSTKRGTPALSWFVLVSLGLACLGLSCRLPPVKGQKRGGQVTYPTGIRFRRVLCCHGIVLYCLSLVLVLSLSRRVASLFHVFILSSCCPCPWRVRVFVFPRSCLFLVLSIVIVMKTESLFFLLLGTALWETVRRG
jgi:hypothetical protein